MKKIPIVLMALLVLALGAATASATNYTLFEWALNVNGTLYGNYEDGSSLADVFDVSLFNEGTNLGTLYFEFSPGVAGTYSILGFFDYEIDEALNTFFNEAGNVAGVASIGQSWEVDEPGYIFGDIYDNFALGSLDNTNAVPEDGFPNTEDVSVAFGWDFNLAADETATVGFTVSETAPTDGLFLIQHDPDSDATLYFSSTLEVEGGGEPEVPIPAAGILFGSGLMALIGLRRKFHS